MGRRNKLVVGVAAALAVAAGGLALTGRGLSEIVLTRALQKAGFPEAAVGISSLGPFGATLAVRLDGPGTNRIGAIDIVWTLDSVLRGRAARVGIHGLALRVEQSGKDIRLAGRSLATGGGTAPPPTLPADHLVLSDAAVTVVASGLTAPLMVSGTLDWPEGAAATFAGVARLTGTPVVADYTGGHDPSTGSGNLVGLLRPVAFGEGEPPLGAFLTSFLGGVVPIAGTVSADARIAWGDGGMTTSGRVLAKAVAAQAGPVTATGINGAIRLSSLVPPVVPAGQALSIKLLDVGLPLTDGEVALGLTAGGRLDVARARWRWGGGTVEAKPFSVALAKPRGIVELQAADIDLGALLALVAVDGLAAEGRLRGRLPVRFGDGTVKVEDGVLEAASPGTLRYDPATPPSFLAGDPGSPTDLLRGALTDFRYTGLSLTMNGEAGGELRVGLALAGANPSFYDGHPVKLNLNVSGALDRILRQSMEAYRIPDAVPERMMDFERTSP